MANAGRVAIVPKGDWSKTATYKRLDAVTYNNTLYFAKKEVPAGTATSNTEYWAKSIVGGAGGIATADEAGIVKPTDGLTVAEDGTLKVSIDGTTLTMDQVNNVIKLADTLKEKINGAFPAANLINNLTTTEAGFGLDARQGKALDDKITEINGSLIGMKNGQMQSYNPVLDVNNFFTGISLFNELVSNSPSKEWYLIISAGIDNTRVQVAWKLFGGDNYIRGMAAGVWGNWVKK
mgnify:CR=1 FL=1